MSVLRLQGIKMTNHSCLSAGILSKVGMNIRAEDKRERWGSEPELCEAQAGQVLLSLTPLLSVHEQPHINEFSSASLVLSKGSRTHGEDGQWGVFYGIIEFLFQLPLAPELCCLCCSPWTFSGVGFLPDSWWKGRSGQTSKVTSAALQKKAGLRAGMWCINAFTLSTVLVFYGFQTQQGQDCFSPRFHAAHVRMSSESQVRHRGAIAECYNNKN